MRKNVHFELFAYVVGVNILHRPAYNASGRVKKSVDPLSARFDIVRRARGGLFFPQNLRKKE